MKYLFIFMLLVFFVQAEEKYIILKGQKKTSSIPAAYDDLRRANPRKYDELFEKYALIYEIYSYPFKVDVEKYTLDSIKG